MLCKPQECCQKHCDVYPPPLLLIFGNAHQIFVVAYPIPHHWPTLAKNITMEVFSAAHSWQMQHIALSADSHMHVYHLT